MTTTTKSRDSRSLLADDSGATMVMGVFMAMMVVGMIYYVWGLGGTIIHRERMQDAADAAAFGASVFQARGMNIIAMLNVLMSVFAIIGTACRLLQTFIEATAIADDAACAACLASIVCIPASEEFCVPAAEHDIEWADSSWLGDIASFCDTIAEGIHGVQVIVRTGALVGAEFYVMSTVRSEYRPTVSGTIFVPGSFPSYTIQSEDDSSTWACHHGWTGMFVRGPALLLVAVGELALFEPIASVGVIAGEIAVGVEEFATSNGSEHYCNNGSLTFQRVPTDSWLGDSHFQNYAAAMGTPPFNWAQGGVAVSNWGRVNGTAPNVFGLDVSVVAELQRLQVADSEYYFEEAEDDCGASIPDTAAECAHQEWLWHTRWRARMRRFHAGSSITGALGSVLSGVQSVIVH